MGKQLAIAQDHKTACALIDDIESTAEHLTYHRVSLGLCLSDEDWQALKEKWLGKG